MSGEVDVRLRLLEQFEALFQGQVYNHRISTNGDKVAYEFYEDLLEIDRSTLLARRITEQTHVLNVANRVFGRQSRRGDGTFGELVPTEQPVVLPGYRVARGPCATLEIGSECKILCVAQSRQIDRVCSDLKNQVDAFKSSNAQAVCIAIVAVNHAESYRSIEGAKRPRDCWRVTQTTGSGSTLHPAQEAAKTIETLRSRVAAMFDEFSIFGFRATNDEPLAFEWVDARQVRQEYASALTRVSRSYAQRFPD